MENKLQIISGKYKGKKLKIPNAARPTQQKARGAVFNMLAEVMQADAQMAVWDAFAGSGAMGIESISRFNALYAVFTDIDSDAVATIMENTKNIRDSEIIVKKENALGFAIPNSQSLTVFVDPPYSDFAAGEKLIAKLADGAPGGTIAVWEIESGAEPIIDGRIWSVLKDKTHGRARFLIMRKNIG